VKERWDGGHSEVFSIQLAGELVAVKQTTKDRMEQLRNECQNIRNLNSCQHVPQVVAFHESNKPQLVIKPAGTPISEILEPNRKHKVPLARLYLLGAVLVRILQQIHTRKLLHLDLRPRNLILRDTSGETCFCSLVFFQVFNLSSLVSPDFLGDFSSDFWNKNLVIIDWETALPPHTVLNGIIGVQNYQSTAWLEAVAKNNNFVVTEFEDLESVAYTINAAILASCGTVEGSMNETSIILAKRQHLPRFIQRYIDELNEQRKAGIPNYHDLATLLETTSSELDNQVIDAAPAEITHHSKRCGAVVSVREGGKEKLRRCKNTVNCPHHRG